MNIQAKINITDWIYSGCVYEHEAAWYEQHWRSRMIRLSQRSKIITAHFRYYFAGYPAFTFSGAFFMNCCVQEYKFSHPFELVQLSMLACLPTQYVVATPHYTYSATSYSTEPSAKIVVRENHICKTYLMFQKNKKQIKQQQQHWGNLDR